MVKRTLILSLVVLILPAYAGTHPIVCTFPPSTITLPFVLRMPCPASAPCLFDDTARHYWSKNLSQGWDGDPAWRSMFRFVDAAKPPIRDHAIPNTVIVPLVPNTIVPWPSCTVNGSHQPIPEMGDGHGTLKGSGYWE